MNRYINRISALSAARRDLGQLAISAIILATGTGVLATGLSSILPQYFVYNIIFGLLIILFGISIALSTTIGKMNSKVVVQGALFLDKKTREAVRVERYDLASDLAASIKALGAENKALGKIWAQNPFDKITETSPGEFRYERTQSRKLAIEAIEYYVLHELSMHLTDYFNSNDEVDESEIHEISRSDFPQVLLDNRFIDLFCRPLEEREAFQNHSDSPRGKVVYAIGSHGELFDDFDFTLPKNATVLRKQHGTIEIATERFSLTITCDIGGNIFPGGFEFPTIYLGKSYNDLEIVECNIHISTKFFPLQALSRKGWQYHLWLDSFLDKITEIASIERFLSKIQWEATLTLELIREIRDKKNTIPSNRGKSRNPKTEDT